MTDLRKELIRLGETDPKLRDDLRPVLGAIDKAAALPDITDAYVTELMRQLPKPSHVKEDTRIAEKTVIWRSDDTWAPDITAITVRTVEYDGTPVVNVKVREGGMGIPVYDSNDEYMPGIIHQTDSEGVAKPPVRAMLKKIQDHLDSW